MRRVAAGVLVCAFGLAAPAWGAPAGDGQWYAQELGLEDIHSSGVTGEGVTIAVIDDGVNPDTAELQGANIVDQGRWCYILEEKSDGDFERVSPPSVSEEPYARHGTSVVSMIVGNGQGNDGQPSTVGVAPDAEVWFYGAIIEAEEEDARDCEGSVWPEGVETDLSLPPVDSSRDATLAEDNLFDRDRDPNFPVWDNVAISALHAIRSGADIISVSIATPGTAEWGAVMAEAIKEQVIVVAAIPNPIYEDEVTPNLSGSLIFPLPPLDPADINGVLSVNATDIDGDVMGTGGDKPLMEWASLGVTAPGVNIAVPSGDFTSTIVTNGTSMAAPAVAGTLALAMEKFPGATPNQLMQALIHTTGDGGEHEAKWQDFYTGFGAINPVALLASDPEAYEDVNPFFLTDVDDPRCIHLTHSSAEPPKDVSDCRYWPSTPLVSDFDSWEPESEEPSKQEGESAADGEENSDTDDPAAQEGDASGAASNDSNGVSPALLITAIGVTTLGLISLVVALIVVRKRNQITSDTQQEQS